MDLQIIGDISLIERYKGYGNLLAYLRNLPEMDTLYGSKENLGYCFSHGSRGRGNGKVETSPLAGSNIWLADEQECVVISQIEGGRGPLQVRVYQTDNAVFKQFYLSTQVWKIIKMYNLPHVQSGPS